MLARKAKAIAFVLVLCLLTAMTVFATEITKPVLSGDLDANDKIDAVDLYYMQKHLLGHDLGISEIHADMNSDGVIDAVDLYFIQKYLLGYSVVVGKTVKIDFDSDGGSDIESAVTSIGMTLEELPEPTLEDKTFSGWYNGETLVDADTVFTESITVKAKWK